MENTVSQFPALMWSPEGECRTFACEKDVPKGWTPYHPSSPRGAAETPAVAPPEKKTELSRDQITQALRDRQIPYSKNAQTSALYAKLIEAVETSEA